VKIHPSVIERKKKRQKLLSQVTVWRVTLLHRSYTSGHVHLFILSNDNTPFVYAWGRE